VSDRTIWLVGAGAIGSVVAGKLRIQPPCRLIDSWREHVEAIRDGGLHVEYPDRTVRVSLPASHIDELEEIDEQVDVVLLAVKSNFTVGLVSRLLPHMSDESMVVSLQNGVNEGAIANVVGAERTIGAVVGFGGELVGPARARAHAAGGTLTIGELDGALTPRLHELAGVLGSSVDVEVTDNIWGELWTKLVTNAQMNALAALAGLPTDEVALDEQLRRIALAVGQETVAVALKLGIELNPAAGLNGVPEAYLDPLGTGAMVAVEEDFVAQWMGLSARPSMLQDLDKGRPTEIDFLNGYVVEKARTVGVPAPVNEVLVELVKVAEADGYRPGDAELRRRLDEACRERLG